MVLRINDGEDDIGIFDGDDCLLTNTERQKTLFQEGYKYEASATQSLMVETLCFMYMGLRHQAHGIPILNGKGKSVGLEPKATFGRVVNLLISSNAFHTTGLEDDLKNYVELRNDLIHEISGTSSNFDFDEFFKLGLDIIKMLKPHFEETLARTQPK